MPKDARGQEIVYDLTPQHKDRTTGVHGAGTSLIETTAHKAAASGYASLNGSTLVVQNPANATATPTASKIPISGTSGYLNDGWMNTTLARSLGCQFSLSCSYVSGTGTAGTNNVAGTVKSITLPANILTQVGDRLRLRTYWKGDTGGPVTATAALNGVDIATSQDVGAASFFVTENYIHYTSGTSANIIEGGVYPATGTHSNNNVGGFAWASTQSFAVMQNQIADNRVIVYCMFADVLPKGVV